jgi:nucleoside-diphosphate-sugar epimerase
MQFVYVNDLVWACMKAMEEPAAVGHAFNIANARPLTQTEVVQALAEAAGRKPAMVRIPRERILQAGGNAMNHPLYFGVYLDMPAITQVISKAQRVLRFKPTAFADGLRQTYRWYQRKRPKQQPDYSFEDRLLSRYQIAATAS